MPTLVSVTVTPVSPFILVNQTQAFVATATYSDSSTVDVTQNVATTWTAVDLPNLVGSFVATISNSGITKGTATAGTISGGSLITATFDGYSGTSTLRVGLANYTRILEQTVDPVKDGTSFNETSLTAAHDPIIRLSVPNISMFTGGVTFLNVEGFSDGYIGYTTVSAHPGDFSKLYVANEAQNFGDWVQLNSSQLATKTFGGSQKNLGIVTAVAINSSAIQLPDAGAPVLVQIAGEGFASTTDGTISIGDFLGPDTNGKVKRVTFNPANPTPIIGFALENFGATFSNKVKMRIEMCGE